MPIISNDISAGSVATPASGNTTLFTDAGQAYIKQASGTVLPIGGLSPSGVTAGSYTLCNLIVDTNGVITTASSGLGSDITTALGYTPYSDANPSGYTSNTGTVTDVSVVTANGISGSVATSTTTPAITLSLGNITPGDVTMTGDLILNSSKKIKGAFSTTAAARTSIQSSTTNGFTYVGIVPNGTSTSSAVIVENDSTQANGAYGNFYVSNVGVGFQSAIRGAGTLLPLNLYMASTLALQVTTAGVVSVPTSLTSAGTITGKLITNNTVPSTSTATGTAGMIAYDASYIYVCTATNTWVRVATATW